MTAVTIGDELQEDRTVAVDDPVLGVLDSLHDSEDIHTVGLGDIKTWTELTVRTELTWIPGIKSPRV